MSKELEDIIVLAKTKRKDVSNNWKYSQMSLDMNTAMEKIAYIKPNLTQYNYNRNELLGYAFGRGGGKITPSQEEPTITFPVLSPSDKEAKKNALCTYHQKSVTAAEVAQHLDKFGHFADPYFGNKTEHFLIEKDVPKTFCYQNLPWILDRRVLGLYSQGSNTVMNRWDCIKGLVNDCWVIEAMGNLTQRGRNGEKLIDSIIDPKENDADDFVKKGVTFNFWHFGENVKVTVDTKLYVQEHDGFPFFVRPMDTTEFWGPLMEKAYAKLYGGYENLGGGLMSEAMEEFVKDGGIPDSIPINHITKENVLDIICQLFKSQAVFGVSIQNTTNMPSDAWRESLFNYSGLKGGHAYTIVDIMKVPYRDVELVLLRLREPQGLSTKSGEWRGAWSDKSSEWQWMTIEMRENMLKRTNYAEFWISLDDFAKRFNFIDICHINAESARDFCGIRQSGKSVQAVYVDDGWRKNYPNKVELSRSQYKFVHPSSDLSLVHFEFRFPPGLEIETAVVVIQQRSKRISKYDHDEVDGQKTSIYKTFTAYVFEEDAHNELLTLKDSQLFEKLKSDVHGGKKFLLELNGQEHHSWNGRVNTLRFDVQRGQRYSMWMYSNKAKNVSQENEILIRAYAPYCDIRIYQTTAEVGPEKKYPEFKDLLNNKTPKLTV